MGFDHVASKKEGPVLNCFGATRELTSEQTCFVIWVIDMTITGIDEVCTVMHRLNWNRIHTHSGRPYKAVPPDCIFFNTARLTNITHQFIFGRRLPIPHSDGQATLGKDRLIQWRISWARVIWTCARGGESKNPSTCFFCDKTSRLVLLRGSNCQSRGFGIFCPPPPDLARKRPSSVPERCRV